VFHPHDGRTFRLKTADQFFFRDTILAVDVEEVVVSSVYLATYNQHSSPLLVCPDHSKAVDPGDHFVDVGDRVLACAVSWPVADQAIGGRVLLFTCVPFLDLAGAPTDHPSRRLADNVITWLVKGPSASTRTVADDPAVRLRAIETGIHRLVCGVLVRKHGMDWVRVCIPERIRVEAAGLRERLREDAPLPYYINLLDLREIIMRNWTDFERLLGVRGKGKDASMGWMDQLNSIRNRVAHPMRLQRAPLTPDEMAFVDERASFVSRVLAAAEAGS
jgi:hypothetical protein